MGRYRFNPFTGTLDDVGTGSGGGGGTVTSVAGGVGITNSPEPIVGAGTVDLDIFSLSTGVAFDGADWLPFVDVSVGTTPAAQRKLTVADLVTGVNGLLDHGLLAGLLDDDHAQYLRLAGRVGTTNDPTLTTSVGGTGTVYGGSDVGAILALVASSSGSAHTGHIRTLDNVQLRPNLTSFGLGQTQIPLLATWTGNIDGAAFAVFGVLSLEGLLTVAAGIDASSLDSTLTRNKLTVDVNTAGTCWPGLHCISNTPVFTANAALTGTGGQHKGLFHGPTYRAMGAGSIGGLTDYGVDDLAVFIGATTVTTKYGHYIHPSLQGGATIGDFFGFRVADFAASGTNLSWYSEGANHGFVHGAWMRVGTTAVLTAPAANVIAHLHGHVLIRNSSGGTTGELRFLEPGGGGDYTAFRAQAQAGAITYDLPAAAPATNGESLTATTAGVMSWAAMQPLDADLTEFAALANVRGDLLITNSTPAWTRLAIGSANRVLRSDGTDPSWAQVALATDVSGTLPIGNGGTGQTTALAAFNALSPLTTRGDLLTRDGTNNIRLAIGASGTVLKSDGTDASWGTIAAPTVVTDVVTGSTSTIPNGSNLTANTVTTTPGSGTEVHIEASVCWDKTGATNKNVVLKLFKDGTEIDTADRYQHFNLAGSAATSQTTQSAHWVIASEASGSHTYTLRLEELAGTANAARRLVSRLTVIY